MYKSVAQYHKIHKKLPLLAKKWDKETNVNKLPQRVKKGSK